MISSLRGQVLHLDSEFAIVDVGGVGFSVAVTPQTSRTFHVGDDIVLHTAMIVREDSLSLFGFLDRDELRVFGHLISVTGVGPKSAMGVLSSLTVAQIADAVATEDDAPFRRVSGIGPKTAKLIVLHLTGKLDDVVRMPVAAGAAGGASALSGQVIAALVALGWNERVSTEAVAAVAASGDGGSLDSVPAFLKQALAHLGPARA